MAGRVRGILERLLARRRDTDSTGVPDAELLRRFVHARDEAAFELLVWRHGSMVLGLCRRAIRDEQLAEDAFQAVFLVLARKAGLIRGNLGGWLFKVARRVAVRAAAKQPNVVPVVETATQQTDATAGEELSAILDTEVARLPERLRRPVVLCYIDGHSTEDAARELGCPRGTVLSRLAAARKRLADRLARRGVTLPAALVMGLSAPLVSTASAAAPKFRSGSLAISPATQLADGVLLTMKRVTLLTVAGVVCAAVFATGIGWSAAQQGSQPNPPPREERTTPTAAKPADPPPVTPKPDQPDPDTVKRAAEEKIRKLERLAESLRVEIEATERQIALLAKVGGTENLAEYQKQFAEVEEELRRANRELSKLEVEATVLKKLIDDKNVPVALDPTVIEQGVDRDEVVVSTRLSRTRASQKIDDAIRLGAKQEQIKELNDAFVATNKTWEEAKKRAYTRVVEDLRAAETVVVRQRVAKLEVEVSIKTEIREKLRAERDAVRKLIDSGADRSRNIADAQRAIQPQRDLLDRVNTELAQLRAGVALPVATGPDAKLDQILKELAALRKDVQVLKAKK